MYTHCIWGYHFKLSHENTRIKTHLCWSRASIAIVKGFYWKSVVYSWCDVNHHPSCRANRSLFRNIFQAESGTTVDGRILHQLICKISHYLFKGFHTCQVVQDFFHQQYERNHVFFTRSLNPWTGSREPITKSSVLLDFWCWWWFQTFFMFTPIWGNDPFRLIFFKWVGSTTN